MTLVEANKDSVQIATDQNGVLRPIIIGQKFSDATQLLDFQSRLFISSPRLLLGAPASSIRLQWINLARPFALRNQIEQSTRHRVEHERFLEEYRQFLQEMRQYLTTLDSCFRIVEIDGVEVFGNSGRYAVLTTKKTEENEMLKVKIREGYVEGLRKFGVKNPARFLDSNKLFRFPRPEDYPHIPLGPVSEWGVKSATSVPKMTLQLDPLELINVTFV